MVQISGTNPGQGKQPILRGQTILFPQPVAPSLVAAREHQMSLPRTDPNRILSLVFVGPRNQFEKWSTQGQGSILKPRWDVLMQTLRALQELGHPAYQNVEIDESQSTCEYFEGAQSDKSSFVFNFLIK